MLTVLVPVVGLDASVAQAPAQSVAGTESSCSVALRPGRWRTSGGNYFWIQCAGTEIFWLGMNNGSDSAPQGAMWTQVGHGTVDGNVIDLRWSDVPYGAIRTTGRIQLQVRADTLLQVTRDDGPGCKPEIRWVSAS